MGLDITEEYSLDEEYRSALAAFEQDASNINLFASSAPKKSLWVSPYSDTDPVVMYATLNQFRDMTRTVSEYQVVSDEHKALEDARVAMQRSAHAMTEVAGQAVEAINTIKAFADMASGAMSELGNIQEAFVSAMKDTTWCFWERSDTDPDRWKLQEYEGIHKRRIIAMWRCNNMTSLEPPQCDDSREAELYRSNAKGKYKLFVQAPNKLRKGNNRTMNDVLRLLGALNAIGLEHMPPMKDEDGKPYGLLL